MRAASAIAELRKLKDEADEPALVAGGEQFTSWRARVKSVFTAALGKRHHLIDEFDGVRYSLSVFTSNTPSSAFDDARRSGIRKVCGLIDAAIYELALLRGDDEPVDERGFDPALWEHVQGIVDAEDWGKVASQVAIYVEHCIRTWADHPTDRDGEELYGKGLYASVLADSSEYRLGSRKAEWEGWRMLGMGFAQALSNVDRHRIQDREDARRYAIGVLGVGSLLLTQLRYQHVDLIKETKD